MPKEELWTLAILLAVGVILGFVTMSPDAIVYSIFMGIGLVIAHHINRKGGRLD